MPDGGFSLNDLTTPATDVERGTRLRCVVHNLEVKLVRRDPSVESHLPFLRGLIAAALIAITALPLAPAAAQDDDDPLATYEELWERGKYQEALDQLEAMLATLTGPGHPRMHANHAKILFDVGRVDEAIAVMETVANDQYEPRYYLELAFMYRYRGRLDEYENALERALATSRGSWRYRNRDHNYIALWRIYEIRGENPKTLLSTSYESLFDKKPTFYPAYVGAGDLAYRHYAYDIAANHYTKALELKPDNQDALAGLAECYWKSSDPRLEETLNRLLELNPNNARAKSIMAERLLDMGKADEALELVDEMLAINPVHIHARSLQAAALFMKDELKAMKETQSKVLEFNPYASTVFRVPGRVASRRYRFKEGAEFQKRALTVQPFDNESRALHGMDLLRLGNEERGREELEKAFEKDPYNVQVFNMLKVLDHVQDFTRIERDPFVLQLPPDEEIILAEDAFGLLEEIYPHYAEKYNHEYRTPIHVQVFDNHDDFIVRSIGLPGNTGYLGICFGNLLTMDSPSARPKWAMNWRSVLLHEFVHVVTLQKTNNRMARWLSEGISVYEETLYDPAWGQRMNVNYKPIVKTEDLPGLFALEQYFTQPRTPNHLMFGYFVAGEFVAFYVETYGQEALTQALEYIADGMKDEDALAKASGATPEEVDQALAAFLEKRFAAYDNLPAIQEPEEVKPNFINTLFENRDKPLPWKMQDSPFTNALQAANSATGDEAWETVETELWKAHELFPDYQERDAPLRQLITLYDFKGEREKLKETLEKQLDLNPTDMPSVRRLAALYLSEENYAKAGEAAEWGLGIDPFDADLRKILVKGQLHRKDIDGAVLSLAQLAETDAPHAAEYRLHRARLFQEAGDTESARREALHILERTPYYWQAQQLLLEIVDPEPNPEAGFVE